MLLTSMLSFYLITAPSPPSARLILCNDVWGAEDPHRDGQSGRPHMPASGAHAKGEAWCHTGLSSEVPGGDLQPSVDDGGEQAGG